MFVFNVRLALFFLVTAMYTISPIDAVPEAAFGIVGIVDDLLLFVVLVGYAVETFRRSIAAAHP